MYLNFNPRTPLQSAIAFAGQAKSRHWYFNPRTPLQSAILPLKIAGVAEAFQSTHSITECDDVASKRPPARSAISIHALHYRVRLACIAMVTSAMGYFNPRTPLQSAIFGRGIPC